MPTLLGTARAVAIDDAEGADEEALLHLYNMLAERQGHLLLAAREPPARWTIRLADLRSRLLAAPAVAVDAPDDALLGAVLVKLFADRQLRISEDLIAYLLPRIERSFAAAQDDRRRARSGGACRSARGHRAARARCSQSGPKSGSRLSDFGVLKSISVAWRGCSADQVPATRSTASAAGRKPVGELARPRWPTKR